MRMPKVSMHDHVLSMAMSLHLMYGWDINCYSSSFSLRATRYSGLLATSIAFANFHRRPEIATISDALFNRETLQFKGANFHR